MNIDINKLLEGNRYTLGKAITLIESKGQERVKAAQKLLHDILPHTGNSIRIGISGSPGVGKSTFIESLGLYLLSKGKKLAVLAIDPSSPVSGGSILGDKTRMEKLSKEENAFIRPSPTSGNLGGVAQKTKEAILLCEASGHDVIIVETVGVGQSEIEVSNMVDFFLVLLLPNSGDELQGIKKGIIEMAHALVINKADGDQLKEAEVTKSHYENALHLFSHSLSWTPPVHLTSALKNEGLDQVWKSISAFIEQSQSDSSFKNNRSKQQLKWMWKVIRENLEGLLLENPKVKGSLPDLEEKVNKGELTPYLAAQKILESFSEK